MPENVSPPVRLTIDHVTIAGSELASLEQAFARVGLTTDYGGPHSNGITHMSLLGFGDGSYIELISSLKPGLKDAVFWGEHISGDGGPCAWAVRVEDIAAETARIAALGIPVDGPTYYYRRRPDGVLVEWHLAFLGEQGAGAKLPFLIQDITPREFRVRPSASVAEGPLTGVAQVILGVKNLAQSVNLFRQVYHWPAAVTADDADFGARLAWFRNAPVVLAAPMPGRGWLAERLARLGESPCAYLIGTDNFTAACQQFDLQAPRPWFDRQVAWFDPHRINDVKLGIVGD